MLRDIFDIKQTANGIDKIKLVQGEGTYPYVTRSDINNGINTFVCEQPGYVMNAGNCISVGLDTQTAFYQPESFYTGQNIQILRSTKLNAHNARFMLPLLKKTLSIFSWGGNGATLTRLRRSRIFLPIDDSGQPDYDFMERYMRHHEQRLIHEYIAHISVRIRDAGVLSLDGRKWSRFFISDVAEIISGRDIYDDERVAGTTPYIGSSALNNGITHFISNTNDTQEAECISVNRNGSVGYAFYHPYEALFSNDCRKLRPRINDKYIALFIARQITAQKDKYSYGYKMGTARLMRQKIMLPLDSSGLPDWQFMHDFMLSLEHHHLSLVLSHFSAKIAGHT